ncbi:response regulator [Phenylobacterium sp.]|uniref:response regulator n=1 Tax=Phenylobacterium sp. TaxID=1871053 RepID=UPI00391905C5
MASMPLPEFFFDRVTADIRQEMEGVLALVDRLTNRRLGPEAQACVDGIAEAAKGVRRLLDSAADLKTVAVDGLTLRPEPLRLRDLADEVQARWQAKAAATAFTLLVSYDGDPEAAAMGDRARLLQTFDGLIAEALGSGGRGAVEAGLKVAATASGVSLEGRVRGAPDGGWGAEDGDARLRAIEARLGLEVAVGAMLGRRIVEAMGGEVRRETTPGASETLVFRVELPAVAPREGVSHDIAPRPAHVLVVDDNATNRMVAQSLVEMFDCTCEAAEDGAEAVEAARSGRFDLILMDIRMPRMDGVAATRAIRALPGRAATTPVIALTANADPDEAEAYLAAGMNGVVEKPMKPEHLLEALKRALREAETA